MSTAKTPEMPDYPNVKIAVKNFGPIAAGTIDLRPLTVFVGPSNTGKTYFSTLIYALHGVFNGFPSLPCLARNIKTLGSHGFILWRKTEILSVLEKLEASDLPFKFSDLPERTRDMVQAKIRDSESLNAELKRCFDLNSIRELIRLKDDQCNEMLVSLEVSYENERLWNFNFETSTSDFMAHGSINENIVLRPIERLKSIGKLDIEDLSIADPFELGSYNRVYLPAARSGIMQSHRVIASSLVERATRGGLMPLEIPTFSGIVADFIQQLILYEDSEAPQKEMIDLAEALESGVLAGQILMKPAPGGYPEFLYYPREMKEEVRLTRAASMVSELAPVVLFLRGGIYPGDTLIIEEPEAHLHPGAQTDIALTLAGLVRAGVRVVVTTHSDWLLKEIANLIRIGELERKGGPQAKQIPSTQALLPEEVGTWWFQKDGSVRQIPFDRTEGVEPKDYEDVAYKLYDRSVNLQDMLEKIDRG